MSIKSRIRKSWLLRMGLLTILFCGFGIWCLYDGLVQYPAYEEKFQQFFDQLTETERGEQLQSMLENPGSGERIEKELEGKSYAIEVQSEEADIPKIVFLDMEKDKEHEVHRRRGTEEAEYYVKSKWDIKTQFLMATTTFAIAGLVLLRIIMVLTRQVTADETSLTINKQQIPFTAIIKLDKRKWYRKSIAVVHYNTGGNAGRFKLDDWIFEGHRDILAEVEKNMRPEAAVVEPAAHKGEEESGK